MVTKILDQKELVEQITEVIISEGMVDREKVTMDATIESLDLKSIDIVMILTAIEEKFDVYIPMGWPLPRGQGCEKPHRRDRSLYYQRKKLNEFAAACCRYRHGRGFRGRYRSNGFMAGRARWPLLCGRGPLPAAA